MERRDQQSPSEDLQGKKVWIPPDIFDSPVIEVTEAMTSGTPSSDVNQYS